MESDLSVVLEALRSKLQSSNLGLLEVYVGDETLIPGTPVVSILGSHTIEPVETGWTVINTFDVTFIIYHARLNTAQHLNRLESIKMVEALKNLLHEDKQLGGMLYKSSCTGIEPGFSEQGQSIMVTTRLTWQGNSKTRI